jgi:hypothetical protein
MRSTSPSSNLAFVTIKRRVTISAETFFHRGRSGPEVTLDPAVPPPEIGLVLDRQLPTTLEAFTRFSAQKLSASIHG